MTTSKPARQSVGGASAATAAGRRPAHRRDRMARMREKMVSRAAKHLRGALAVEGDRACRQASLDLRSMTPIQPPRCNPEEGGSLEILGSMTLIRPPRCNPEEGGVAGKFWAMRDGPLARGPGRGALP